MAAVYHDVTRVGSWAEMAPDFRQHHIKAIRAAYAASPAPTLSSRLVGYQRECDEVEQVLGKALGYPWFKDDQKNFPGATEENGVCIGDNVPSTIAMQAASRLASLEADNRRLREALEPFAFIGRLDADKDRMASTMVRVGLCHDAETVLREALALSPEREGND